MYQVEERLLIWLLGSRWWLHQTQDRLMESAHQDVDYAGLQGEQVPSEDDVNAGDSQESK